MESAFRPSRRALLTSCAALLPVPLLRAFPTSGEDAPRFHATSIDGEKFTNESLKGKVTLLQFWATWCPYCHADEPAVEQITRDFRDRGLVVLAIDVNESKKKVMKYLASSPRSCKIILSDQTNLPAMFETKSFPLYVLLDRNGYVVGRQNGAGGEAPLRSLLRKAGLSEADGSPQG